MYDATKPITGTKDSQKCRNVMVEAQPHKCDVGNKDRLLLPNFRFPSGLSNLQMTRPKCPFPSRTSANSASMHH